MIHVKEAIVVEGRYDKSKLSSLIDGIIVETGGFGIFRDKEKMEYLKTLAARQGLIVLTDSDGAGFLIRGKLSSLIPKEQLKHAYIPDVMGKERRKQSPSKEGKLGVEGMKPSVLYEALKRAGATIEGEPSKREPAAQGEKLSKVDLFALGLSGTDSSAGRRLQLQKAMGLPSRLSANGLLQAINALYDKEEFLRRWEKGLEECADGADEEGP